METKVNGFVSGCMEFFGKLPDQGLREFADEVKQLTPATKLEIWEGLQKNGIACQKPE